MRIDGIQLVQGSNISNLTVASGTSFPSSPDSGELFYRTDAAENVRGLYCYIGGSWDRIASSDSLTAPSGASFPSTSNVGDLYYKDTNDTDEGLYLYNGTSWNPVGASAASYTITGDVTGTIDGGTDALTLATVATATTTGSASDTILVTINAKGLTTSVSSTPIAIAASQTTSGTFADARISQSSVTQHQGSLELSASQTTSGTFADARIAQSNVTQHQSALSLAASQITTGTFADARVAESNVTQHQAALSLAASQTTSGTFADARISQSSVTQHQAALSIAETQIPDGSVLARVAGNETISGNWTFNNVVIGTTPTSASHLTTKGYVDNALAGLTWKHPVRVATTGDITLSGTQTIDGVAVTAGDRVLVKSQNTGSENGVYVVASGTWTRATDFDETSPIDEVNSAAVFVSQGTTLADTGWTQTAAITTVGTEAMVFVQFSAAGSYTAGAGLSLVGNDFRIGTASTSRIVVNVDDIDLATVTDSGTGSFSKLTVDSYGRVTGTTPVIASDITGLVDSAYVNISGDTMTGNLAITESTNASANLTLTNSSAGAGADARFVLSNGTDTAGMILRGTGHSTPNLVTIFGTGSNALQFQTGATEKMRLANGGQLLIGGTSQIGTEKLLLSGGDARVHGSSAGTLFFSRDLIPSLDSGLGGITFQARGDATTYLSGAQIIGLGEGTWTATSAPSYLSFRTSAASSTTPTERARITSGGNVLIGTTAARTFAGSNVPQVQVESLTNTRLSILNNAASSTGAALTLGKTRGGATGAVTAVASGDSLGLILFEGADGTGMIRGAQIAAEVDGTPGTSDMPGRLVFSTTTDGASTATERMRIDSLGNVGIGVTPSSWTNSYIVQEYQAGFLGANDPNTFILGANTYVNGGVWKYKASNAASLYSQAAGVHSWQTAASGTAGNTATFTERMRITADGGIKLGQMTTQSGALTLANADAVAGKRLLLTFPSTSNWAGTLRVMMTRSTGDSSGSNHQVVEYKFARTGAATGSFAFFSVTSSIGGLYTPSMGAADATWYLDTTTGIVYFRFGHSSNSANYYYEASINDSTTLTYAVDAGTAPSGTVIQPSFSITNGGSFNYLMLSTGGTEAMRITNSGQIGVGTTAPAVAFQLGGDSTYREMRLRRSSDTAAAQALSFLKTRGSETVPTAVSSSDTLGTLTFAAWDGSSTGNAAWIQGYADATATSGSTPGRLIFGTAASGSITPTERMRIDSSGLVGIGAAATNRTLEVHNSTRAVVRMSANATTGTDALGGLEFSSYDGTSVGVGATILHTYSLQSADASALKINVIRNAPFAISTNNTERLRIDGSGNTLLGTVTSRALTSGAQMKLQVESIDNTGGLSVTRNTADTSGPNMRFLKTRGTAVNAITTVAAGDSLGQLQWFGTDGTGPIPAAEIRAEVDATPGTNDMPGRIVFLTTADGASTASERMRLNSSGQILIGSTTAVNSVYAAANAIPGLSVFDAASASSSILLMRNDATNAAATGLLSLGRSRNATTGSHTVVTVGDTLGAVNFVGSDGSAFKEAAKIIAQSDTGTPSATSMAGRLAFFTTPNASVTPAERMRIDSSGNVGIGVTPTTRLHVVDSQAAAVTVATFANGTAGTTAQAIVGVSGDTAGLQLGANSSTFTTTATFGVANEAFIRANAAAAGLYLTTGAATPMRFGVNNAERMRIDSSGNAQIGATAALGTERLLLTKSAAGSSSTVLTIQNSGTTTGTGANLSFVSNTNTTAAIALGTIATVATDTSGSGDMTFQTTSSGTSTERMRLTGNSTGELLVGVSSPRAYTAGLSRMKIQTETIDSTAGISVTRNTADTSGGIFRFAKTRATSQGGTTAAAAGDAVGHIQWYTFTGGASANSIAEIRSELEGTPSSTSAAGRIVFATTLDGTTTQSERMRIDNAGNVLVTGPGGMGYGTGSGGAVTQATSRTTGVTLNKTNGAITLVSAAGTATWQSFTVTNSTVAATDVIRVCQKSGTDLYMIHVTAVAAGSFRISFATTGGTTTEQPVFNFAVVKAVTA